MNKIIYCGGFDPIHLGHLNSAKQASAQLDADVIFVPAIKAIWKEESISSINKVEMVKLAIKEYPRFFLDTYEIDSGNDTNYSIDTIRYFKTKYPDDNLFFLLGSDQVNKFHLWKSPDEIAKMVQIIYFKRPNYEIEKENVKRFNMKLIDGKQIDTSSSDIRLLKSFLIPESLIKYIEDNDLYYIHLVKEYIHGKRYIHSISVANLAYKIAKANNLNPQKAYVAGLLHDIGKQIPKENETKIMEENYKKYMDLSPMIWHQFTSEFISKKEFEIDDEEILNSIKFHTTGNDKMDWLAKIIYASDKIEPTRGFDSKDLIEAMEKDVDNGFKIVLKANKDFLESNRENYNNHLTSKCFEKYLK